MIKKGFNIIQILGSQEDPQPVPETCLPKWSPATRKKTMTNKGAYLTFQMASHLFAHQHRHTFEHQSLWFQRHFLSQLCSLELTSMLNFPRIDLFLLKATVMFKRERAAEEVFRGEDLPTNGCVEDWGYWFVKQTDLHQKKSLQTSTWGSLAAAAPGDYGDQAWLWRRLPMQNHFPDGVRLLHGKNILFKLVLWNTSGVLDCTPQWDICFAKGNSRYCISTKETHYHPLPHLKNSPAVYQTNTCGPSNTVKIL